ncbi:portal protein [Azorhizobium caulinodans]|uniref:portal protein n=1 Tax=Azorhizobium caulinodans TaxID=7 RepID=UPI0005C6A381|nr:portal protein [Azorhizobium caulinodans]
MKPATTAAGRYTQLATIRSPYLERARDCATLTIPSLMPRAGHGAANDLPTPFQGMGARGVNNLGSKLLLALMPPNQPFFRLMLDDFALQELTGQDGMRTEVEKALGQIERAVQTEVETGAIRVSAFEALKQLLVAGNVLLYVQPTGGVKVYRLDRYVVKRDPSGNVLEIVIHERVSPLALPEELQRKLGEQRKGVQDTIDLYTWIRRESGKFVVHQEVKGEKVPGTDGEWPTDKAPFIALRWAKIDGEDYGRGHVEEYIGDLRSLEALTRAIVEGAAAAAKVLFLVNPNGVTNERTISEAPNMAVRSGNKEDVNVLQVEKFNDFRVALETVGRLEIRLSQAFLLTSSIQRDAERVTAEEIRVMAGELEDALGGVYSILAQEFQLPLVRRLIFQMEQDERLPSLPPDLVKPSIITGMEALGRGHDLNRLMMFAKVVNDLLGPGALPSYADARKLIERAGVALSVDTSDILKSDEQLQAEQMQAQQQALLQSLGAEVLKTGLNQENANDAAA